MKVAVVTGASGEIGGAIAKKLIESGYFVLAQYSSNPSGIDNIKKQLGSEELTNNLFGVFADFSTAFGYQALVDAVNKSFKHIDVIVNVAGVDLYNAFGDTTDEQLSKVMNVNFNSAFMLTSKLIPQLHASEKGKIVFISSIWGEVGGSMESAYSASKSALIGLTKSLAKELAPITVNCVCPGVIDTKMNDIFSCEEKQELIDKTPLKRFGKAEEVGDLVDYLVSDKGDFITGQIITIDGGFTL